MLVHSSVVEHPAAVRQVPGSIPDFCPKGKGMIVPLVLQKQGPPGIEPGTCRTAAGCSTTELWTLNTFELGISGVRGCEKRKEFTEETTPRQFVQGGAGIPREERHQKSYCQLDSLTDRADMSTDNVLVGVRARPLNEKELRYGPSVPWNCDGLARTISYSPSTQNDVPISPIRPPTVGDPFSTPERPKTKTPAGTPARVSTLRTPMASTPMKAKTPAKTLRTGEMSREQTYSYDCVFEPDDVTQDVYDTMCGHVIKASMEGYNGTIFTYGQTSSGKTFTMKGSSGQPGIIPLSIYDIFSYIEQSRDREFVLRVSYLEIYNEIINDLLAPDNVNLKVHEDKSKGVYVGNLKEEVVLSPEHVFSLISGGEAHRHIGATDFNEQSSRSHTIFRMVIESREIIAGNPLAKTPVKCSLLNLIDLAGSERASQDVKDGEQRRKEGAYINKSLLTLGQVIYKLSEKNADRWDSNSRLLLTPGSVHIPYRDSKLTRILQNSLGGNAKIAVICTISLCLLNFEETNSTLKFASRAKKMKNTVTLNEVMDDKTLIRKYQNEILELKKKLEDAENTQKSLEELDHIRAQKEKMEANFSEMNEKLAAQELAVAAYQEKIRHLNRLILNSSNVTHSQSNDFVSPQNSTERAVPRSGERRNSLYRSGAGKILDYSADLVGSPTTPRRNLLKSSGNDEEEMEILRRENAALKEKLRQAEERERQNNQVSREKEMQEQLLEMELQVQILKADNNILTEQLRDSEAEVSSLTAVMSTWGIIILSRRSRGCKIYKNYEQKSSSKSSTSKRSTCPKTISTLKKLQLDYVCRLCVIYSWTYDERSLLSVG
ncbi:kinesin family member 11 [Planoprotostelium fungivorum]|uniref:Kinesin family member 11 n=1 Tax=Planoprotostelium fungivorum TaxID=1890364 RepID=A0A2P6N0T1_9EUKA|nr:kinesin family member 11 [Planoprotostelium fungivorum]